MNTLIEENKILCETARTLGHHNSQVFDELLDKSENEQGKKRPIYADSAYRSQEHETQLAIDEIESQICEKGTKSQPLTEGQKNPIERSPKCERELNTFLVRRQQ